MGKRDDYTERLEFAVGELARNEHPQDVQRELHSQFGMHNQPARVMVKDARAVLHRAVALRMPHSTIELSTRLFDISERALVAGDFKGATSALREYRQATQGLVAKDYTANDVAVSLLALLMAKGQDIEVHTLRAIEAEVKRVIKRDGQPPAKGRELWRMQAQESMAAYYASTHEASVTPGTDGRGA